MSIEDMENMMGLLNHAPWAEWGTQSIDGTQAKAIAKPGTQAGSEAMDKAQESLDALSSVCSQMKALYRKCQTPTIAEKGGSIPSLLKAAMTKVDELEKIHMQPIADFIYGHDEEGTSFLPVNKVKIMLKDAAPAAALVNQAMIEIKTLSKAKGTV